MEAAVYHLDGRRVLRVLGEQRVLSAGSYEIGWDGRDEGWRLGAAGACTACVCTSVPIRSELKSRTRPSCALWLLPIDGAVFICGYR